jgi:hypothetical protein
MAALQCGVIGSKSFSCGGEPVSAGNAFDSKPVTLSRLGALFDENPILL